MLEFLRDSIWQFVGAALGLAAIIVTVLTFRAQRNKKALVYEIETYTLLVTVNAENQATKDQIEIRFKGAPVANVYLLMMRVWNNGNAPILPGDFVETLGFRLADGAEILTAEVVKAEPEALKPELQSDGAALSIAPLLLNGKDSFTVKLLVAGGGEKAVVKASGRIAGVKAVMRAEAYTGRSSDRMMRALLTILFALSTFGIVLYSATLLAIVIFRSFVVKDVGLFFVGLISMVLAMLLSVTFLRGRRLRPG